MGAISLKDNDSLAAMLAAEVQADLLVLMSDVDGIYTKPPSQEGARLLCTYTPDMKDLVKFGKKSRVGTGGMDSKVNNFYYMTKYNQYQSKYNLFIGYYNASVYMSDMFRLKLSSSES